ncbi:hypothetical protein KBTX_04433 [wastewater metagenome]|uniref:Uncharacterized protein n=2 Tax=unclassified sequences TaxID=12908 RepID=A0A5B8RL80_9ZZZZ|nr:hypothetical protein KBTEX_04433 [uncultured organism]
MVVTLFHRAAGQGHINRFFRQLLFDFFFFHPCLFLVESFRDRFAYFIRQLSHLRALFFRKLPHSA